jgi:hypothetical protein
MEYPYDVAFSFLAQDEALATELNDLLQGRLKTFLYSRRQEQLAGADGEEKFNEVFAQQARVVVVLYREGWGDSPWTRIEQTAIRNRAYDHGYEFVKFIPLDEPPSVPKWLPRTRLWIGLKRWGIAAAAGVIEARVQELGGEPQEETVAVKAARAQRSILFAQSRKQFLKSDKAVKASNEVFAAVESEAKGLVEELQTSAPAFQFSFKSQPRQFVILGRGPALLVYWNYHYSNSLDGSHLEVTFWQGHPPWPNVRSWDKPKEIRRLLFEFDVTPQESYVWVSSAKDKRAYSSKEFAAYLLEMTIEYAEKYKGS